MIGDGVGGRAAVAWGPVIGDRDLASLGDGVDGDAADALTSVAIAGDLDDDGVDDLVLGAPAPWDRPGSVAVVYGPIGDGSHTTTRTRG